MDTGGTTASGGEATNCPIGAMGCACTLGGSCDDELVCRASVCVAADGSGGSSSSGAGGLGTAGEPPTGGRQGVGGDTSNSGGEPGAGGRDNLGGEAASGGMGNGGVSNGGNRGGPDHCLNQNVNHSPGGTVPYISFTADTVRNGLDYQFYSGDKGSGFGTSTITYRGAQFDIEQLDGTGSQNDVLLGPQVLCGALVPGYLESGSSCGLPVDLSTASRIDFGARYAHAGEGWDYSVFIDLRVQDALEEEAWVSVSLRLSESFSLDSFDVATGVLVGNDPEPWSVAFRDEPWPVLLFFRPGAEQAEFAGDARDFIAIANDDYDFGAEILAAASAGIYVYRGLVTNLSLEDFCIQVE